MSPKRKGLFIGIIIGGVLVIVGEIGLITAYAYISDYRAMTAPEAKLKPIDIPTDTPIDYNYTFKTADGKELPLESLRGKTIVLSIWRSGCTKCWTALPSLERLYQKTKDMNVAFVSVALGKNEEEVAEKIAHFNVTFPVYREADSLSAAFPKLLATTSAPTVYVIKPDGAIAFKHAGAAIWDAPAALALIEKLSDAGETESTPESSQNS